MKEITKQVNLELPISLLEEFDLKNELTRNKQLRLLMTYFCNIERINSKSEEEVTKLLQDQYKLRDNALRSLPTELVTYKGDIIEVYRLSSVLSQNDELEAMRFIEGFYKVCLSIRSGQILKLTERGGKGNIATQLFRNLGSEAILKSLILVLDRNAQIQVLDGRQLINADLPYLMALYAKGVSDSVNERSDVYDGLFDSKYSKSHFNQYLQWSFGLARRQPESELQRLLVKYNSQISVDQEDIVQRSEMAIQLLRAKTLIFGLSQEGLETAINKIEYFITLLQDIATHSKRLVCCGKALKKGFKGCPYCLTPIRNVEE